MSKRRKDRRPASINQTIKSFLFSTETEKNKKKKTLEQDFEIPITQELEREVSEMLT